MNSLKKLAVHGGEPVTRSPFPPRKLFKKEDLNSVARVFKESWDSGVDFGSQGIFEEKFCQDFLKFLGQKGYCDAVSSGTIAIYVALKAIGLQEGDEVAVSPITSPGSLTPVIELNSTLTLIDSELGTNYIGLSEFKKNITKKTRALIVTHPGGFPIPQIQEIVNYAHKKDIYVIEDCSQAHGAICQNKKVGSFGDISIWSTMFSKTISTGGTGGVIYTKNKKTYNQIRSFSDRGKPFHKKGLDLRNPQNMNFPSMNFNLNEISCSIGSSVLSRASKIIKKRQNLFTSIAEKIRLISGLEMFVPCDIRNISPFYCPVFVEEGLFRVSKTNFARAVLKEGIPLNPHYLELVSEWNWVKEYISGNSFTPNAKKFRDKTFNLYLHEGYTNKEVEYIYSSLSKVKDYFLV